MNLHMGAEAADFHRRMAISRDLDQTLEAAPTLLRSRRTGEAWTHALAGVGSQRELRHKQQAAAGFGHGQVHSSRIVGKDPITEQSFCQPLHLRLAIAGLHGDQRQQSRADAADRFSIDFDMRRANALYQGQHACLLASFASLAAARRPSASPNRGVDPLQSRACPSEPLVRWYIALLHGLLRLTGRLPLPTLHRIGTWLGWLLLHTPNPVRRNARATLSLLITQFGTETRQSLLESSLREAGKSIFEICRIWSGDAARALALVRDVRGADLFNRALADRRGLIIAAPHLGCWELLNFWLCSRTPIAIAYRPPRQPALEPLLLRARGALAAEQVRADGPAGVRKLYKRLIDGGVVGILPDQQPKLGEGEFAPFFGTPALTMVLLSRLARRTGATVLFAFAERLADGAGFRIHFLPAPQDIAAADLSAAVAALNRGVEACVRIAPAQYQWQYRRYSIRPPGDERNLY